MRVLGIELASSKLVFVCVEGDSGAAFQVTHSNRLVLSATRSRDALVAFQNAILTLYNATGPGRIAVKEKPEAGRLRAGAAALKMEGILLANAPCDVVFISGARINQCAAPLGALPKYYEPALRAAVVALS